MDKVLGMIGLAVRARKIVSGEFLCDGAIKNGSSRLIIIADDISEKSKKNILNSCEYYKIRNITYGKMSELGRLFRSDSRAVLSVNDKKFADAIINKFNETTN